MGLVTGAIYAVTASGLVVNYATSGVFNLAHGAIGMIVAFAYWELYVHRGLPAWLALALALAVVAPAVGLAVGQVVAPGGARPSTRASLLATLGILLATIGLAYAIWDPTEPRSLPELFAGRTVRLPGVTVTAHQLVTLAMAGLAALGLRLLLYRTRTGVGLRALVDDPELVALHGLSPARMSQLGWAGSAVLAGLAGILVAPQLQLAALPLTFLVVNGYAAALVGGLRSLPLTFAGALALGLGESYAVGYLPTTGALGLVKPALPMLLLALVLLARPVGRLVADRAPVRPVPPVMGRRAGLGSVAFVAAALPVSSLLAPYWLGVAGLGLAVALVMLSLVLLTGHGGQISLCQMTFVGLGAVVMAKTGGGGSVGGLLAAAVVCTAAGGVLGLAALRMQGLSLALFTLAVAAVAYDVFFLDRRVFGRGGLVVGRVGSTGDRAWFLVLATAFAAASLAVVAIRRGRYGRLLAAAADSPVACATLGLNLVGARLGVFALSAGVAGVAGALFGGLRGIVTASDFTVTQSLMVLLLLSVCGVRSVAGALLGGMTFALLPLAQAAVPGVPGLVFLATGAGSILVARQADGVMGLLGAGVRRPRASVRMGEGEGEGAHLGLATG